MSGVAQQDTVHEHCSFGLTKCRALASVLVDWKSDCLGIKRAVVPFAKITRSDFEKDLDESSGSIYLVFPQRKGALCWNDSFQRLREVLIPNTVRELCDGCFKGCKNLRRVTFGGSSSLEWIGDSCFAETGVEEVSIPDGVRNLGDWCFSDCKNLSRVTFGSSSSLERIGYSCFGEWRPWDCGNCPLTEISIPDGVRELCARCLSGCCQLRRVTIGFSSSLERIGFEAFGSSEHWLDVAVVCNIVEIRIPDGVRELGDGCFGRCSSLRRVTFGSSSSLERIGVLCFQCTSIGAIGIPNSVRELCDLCFTLC